MPGDDLKPNAYGSEGKSGGGGGGDTGFRRKFSAQDYSQPDGDQGQRKRKQRVVDSVMKMSAQTLARPDEIDFTKIVNKKQIVHAAVRDTGFHCSLCNMVFKDNVTFLDHLTTRDHLMKAGIDATKKATLDQVKQKFEELKAKRNADLAARELEDGDIRDPVQVLQDRIKLRQAQLMESKQRKADLKKIKKKIKQEEPEAENQDEMLALMGFSGFIGKK